MDNHVGQQLGNYRLSRLLGKGGFAEVYLGEHVYLKTPAAIKLLRIKVADESDLEDFLKEAQTIAQLVHPHIVRVLEFGLDGETPFLVMDYAPNGTLRQRHPKGSQLPLTTIIPYVQQIAEALHYAHEEKFIHRDVKPENMLVGRRDTILLSDFGIALIAQSSHYQSTQDVIGTVAYMSPEQIQGKPRPASDQYSLAVVVYEWLGGNRPFHGSFTELCTQHMFAPPPPLHEKGINIPSEVEAVVMTALAKDPRQRFGNVRAFANALAQASQLTGFSLSHTGMMVPSSNEVTQSIQSATSSQQLTPPQASSNETSEPTIVWASTADMPPPANGELSLSTLVQPPVMGTPPSQAAPQAPLSSPGIPYASRGISRRTVILGLGLAGLAVAGGGIVLLSHKQGPQASSPLSTPPPTSRPTSAPTAQSTSVLTARPTLAPTAHPTPTPTPSPTPTPAPTPTPTPTSAPTITSILQGAVATPPSQVNLTSEGISDWIHWGLYTGSTVDRKAASSLQISTFSTIGNVAAIAYGNNGVAYSWSDGTPDRAITNTTTGVYISGVNNGFSFSVPASTTTRTLRVYVDAFVSQGKFTASLTDGSGLVYADESLNNAGGTAQGVYTLTFRSSSNGQQLIITFVEVNAYNKVANVALEAATLQ